MDQLSSMDASFLHFETPETPMHVGSLMLFELPEGYDGDYYEDVKAMLAPRASKLAGAIAGRALYDGRLDPAAALALIKSARAAA